MSAPPTADDLVEVRISGEGVTPATLPWRDLVDVLTLTAEAVESVAAAAGNRPGAIRLSLTGIGEGSATPCLDMSPAAGRAARRYAESLTPERFASLPLRARQRTQALREKVISRGWEAVTIGPTGGTSAIIRPDTNLPDRLFYSGPTTLHAFCVRAGGEGQRASATLRLSNRRTIHARVASEELVKQIRAYTLENVSVGGNGTWDAVTHRLVAFRIDRLEPVQPEAGLDRAGEMRRKLKAIADASSGWWREVDPDEFVAELRRED